MSTSIERHVGAAPALATKIEPTQSRARATVARILDTSAVLLEEVGVQGLNTNLIAERAGITVPTVYRYFPNKFAVLKALGERLFERLNDVYAPMHERGELHRQPIESIVLGFDQTLAIIREEPGAIAIMRALRAVPILEEVLRSSHERVATWFATAIEVARPDLSAERRWTIARMCVEISYGSFELALTDPRLDVDAVIAELERNLDAYWATYASGRKSQSKSKQ